MHVDNYMPECLLRRSFFFKAFPVKPVLKKIKISYTRYFEEFTSALYRHLETEYEVLGDNIFIVLVLYCT